ncbi:MAG: D-alanine--D-alanine ligase family protein [Solirubrobacterales bacterium]
MRVAVLRGGRSSERDVSLRSGEAVMAGLAEGGHEALDVVIDEEGQWTHDGHDVELVPGAGLLGADVAFPALHGPFGEDGTVQGVLETLGSAYVGSGVLASAACMDKITCKRLLAHHGVEQVGFAVVGEPGWRERVTELDLPVWVKPSRLGSSVGISRVDDRADLDDAVQLARDHDPRVIVEQHSPGREIECSVLGNDDPEVSPPGEIVIDADWYDFESKYEEGQMRLDVPADLPDEVAQVVRTQAAEVYRAMDCAGLARCDFFVTSEHRILVNEINTLPGFTATSVYAKLFAAAGVEYAQLCDRLLELAVQRRRAEAAHSY